MKKEGSVNSQRKHWTEDGGLVVAADIKKAALFVELPRLGRIVKLYDNFAMFSEEAAQCVP